jgi:hypothetical protein
VLPLGILSSLFLVSTSTELVGVYFASHWKILHHIYLCVNQLWSWCHTTSYLISLAEKWPKQFQIGKEETSSSNIWNQGCGPVTVLPLGILSSLFLVSTSTELVGVYFASHWKILHHIYLCVNQLWSWCHTTSYFLGKTDMFSYRNDLLLSP